MLTHAKPLHDLGFSLLWLHPKSKRPIGNDWTKGPRKSWEQLARQYQTGMNLGVRLGRTSETMLGYLGVIDCDVKSQSPEHLKEMRESLSVLFPGNVLAAPQVLSGRGNGSCHYYITTDEPLKPERVAHSEMKIRVAGRDSWAWEIAVMGEGQQVVLPPSVHPDSGKAYKWATGKAPEFIVSVELIQKSKTPEVRKDDQGLREHPLASAARAMSFDLTRLSDKMQDLYRDGKGCQDRSASLMSVTLALVGAGASDDQILALLTDSGTYLGQAAYEHAKTNSRERAAQWVRRYTLTKGRATAKADTDFDDGVEVSYLSDEASEAQAAELHPESVGFETSKDGWKLTLDRDKVGRVKATAVNMRKIIEGEAPECIRRDLFARRDFFDKPNPWGSKVGNQVTDDDINRIKFFIAHNYRIEPSLSQVSEVVNNISISNAFHPVREYLDALEWDGVNRIGTWLKDYLGCVDLEPYLSAVSRKTLIAMVARIYRPGIKFDHMLVLEGLEGLGKSTVPSILASPKWFCDTLPDVRDKDSMLNLVGAWIIEMGELAALKKADDNTQKAFFSRSSDRVRAPYGERWEEYPRQCVFVGTTNLDDYLKAKTGNRRFWPVTVHEVDFEGLAAARDQLFAEAVFHYENLNEALYLDDSEVKKQAVEAQLMRVAEDMEDAMFGDFSEWIIKQRKGRHLPSNSLHVLKVPELLESGHALEKYPKTNHSMQLIARILKKSGYEKYTSMGISKWRKWYKAS